MRIVNFQACHGSRLLRLLAPRAVPCPQACRSAALPHHSTWRKAHSHSSCHEAPGSPHTALDSQISVLSSRHSIAAAWKVSAQPRQAQRAHRYFSVSASADPGAQDETVQGGRLVLVDAMSFIYRAHHGYGSTRLMSDAGVDTTIIYTFVSAVLALLELQPPPTHIACVFDAPGKTFRNEIYPGYKGQRPPRPLEIGESLPYIRQMLRLMGVHEVTVNGVEADDVIGTLATRAIHAGMLVAIASPDKDFFQLLQPGLQMLRPAKRNVMAPLSTVAGNLVPYTADAFIAEYGIQPHQWADVLALSGDASDNIPGVNGIGAKGALNLVKQFDDVESILEHASQVKRKQSREALLSERGQAEARLAKRLVTIQTEMDLPPLRKPLQDLALLPPSPEQVRALQEGFAELDFRYPTERMMAVWERMKADLVAETHEVMSI